MDYSRISKQFNTTNNSSQGAVSNNLIKKPKSTSTNDTLYNNYNNISYNNKSWSNDDASHYDDIYINEEQIEESIRHINEQQKFSEYVNDVYDYLYALSKQSYLPIFDELKIKDLYQLMYDTNVEYQSETQEQIILNDVNINSISNDFELDCKK
jgi:hypothetical protein